MGIATEGRIELNVSTSNNNAIDMHVRREGRLRLTLLSICSQELLIELNITF